MKILPGNRATVMRLKGQELLVVRGLGMAVGMNSEGTVEYEITGGKEGKVVKEDPRVLKKKDPQCGP